MPKASTENKPRSLREAWVEVAKVERDVVGTATRAVERVPAPVDVYDSALLFATRVLRGQRDALVPLLQGVGPKTRTGEPSLKSAAEAVKDAFDLAESVVETQRKLLRGLIETVTPPLARHAEPRVDGKPGPVRRPSPSRHPKKQAI
jgi:hypothetical protein